MKFFSSGIKKGSLIAVDMDNTLVDEFGATVRPGIERFLTRLCVDYTLMLWTNSTRDRARRIIRDHDLEMYFAGMIFREDYDPENRGVSKDCRKYKAAFLIDDDPAEIRFNERIGVKGFLIKSYRKSMSEADFSAEYQEILRKIQKG